MTLKCSDCDYKQQQLTSPRLGKAERQNDGFEANSRGILFTHEIGLGYASLNKLCAVYGMLNMCEKTFQKKDKAVCNTIDAAAVAAIETVVDLVKAAYTDTYPLGTEVCDEHDNEPQNSLHFDDDDDWNVDDSRPWIDVTFDGTWHKRGFTSVYGVAVVIDILTGYVTDDEVLSKYCQACAVSESKDMTDDQRQVWNAGHDPKCLINHDGSSKAMEREAAKALWGHSVAQHGLHYRTMLSDGDSVAFAAVTELQPYGATRPVKKVECVNHVHKRMGTALRKQAQECRLGGRGQGRLTADKCRKLQNYFRGAILGNKGKPKEMEVTIWASIFHCTSTDTDPHHGRCPDGENSWCFYKKAQALGEQPGPHADNLTTIISRDVTQQLLPLYRRMSCNTLLSKVLHGKTQNNESLNSMMWAHCPKTVFVGKRRIDSAVATAVCKFNRGNLFLAELMDTMLLQPSEFTINILEAKGVARLKQADKAADAQFAVCRRHRHIQQAAAGARQEDQEGEVYGAGMMADH